VKRYAVVDVETTGASAAHGRVIEIGIVEVPSGRKFHTLVCPDRAVPHWILRLTGIDSDELLGAPSFEEVAPLVRARLHDRVFVAHNASFDLRFLRAEFARLGEKFEPEVFCTRNETRRRFPGLGRYDLDTLARQFGIRIARRHRALDDALAAAELLRLCLGRSA